MNSNFAKLVAIGIMGGVVKALFRPASIHTHNHYPEPATVAVVEEENN